MDLVKIRLSEVLALLSKDINTKFYIEDGSECIITKIEPLCITKFYCQRTVASFDSVFWSDWVGDIYIKRVETKTKKEKLESIIVEMLNQSHVEELKMVDKAIECVDFENWNPDVMPMALPKTIVTAIMELEARQYSARRTGIERKIKKEIESIKRKIIYK